MSVLKYAEGEFCWDELMTTDSAKAMEHYKATFGWDYDSSDMGDFTYHVIKIGERMIGGTMDLPDPMKAMGIPSHWMGYIKVDSIEAMIPKIEAAGGSVVMPKTEIPETGWFSLIASPTEEHFTLFEYGYEIPDDAPKADNSTPGTFNWHELYSRDFEASKKFYSEVFGWNSQEMEVEGGHKYTFFSLDEETFVAGGMEIGGPDWEGVPPHWGRYITVENCDATVEKAKAAGGTPKHDPFDIPQWGRVCFIEDPTGAHYAIVQHFPKPDC